MPQFLGAFESYTIGCGFDSECNRFEILELAVVFTCQTMTIALCNFELDPQLRVAPEVMFCSTLSAFVVLVAMT